MMDLITYSDRDALALGVARALASDLRSALHRRERALFCVGGGTTPGPVFDLLCGIDLDWGRIDVVLSDERWVPETDPRSNTALVRGRLLRGAAAAARLIPLHMPTPSPWDAVGPLTDALIPALPIDVALLGMGADMHTASLFADGDELDAALADDAPPLVPISAPAAPEPRITLSARTLRAAFALHLMITGPEKRAALDRARTLPPTQAPVAALLGQATVHWAD